MAKNKVYGRSPVQSMKAEELKVLQIETINICNAKCVFCQHKNLKEFGTMSDELFLKILTDAKEIPSITTIVPMLMGEPFCDKKIVSRIQLIRKMHPDKRIVIFTNGSLITPGKIKRLAKVKNFKICFSLNAASRKERKDTMGLNDYDYVVEMIELWKKTGKDYEVIFVQHPLASRSQIKKWQTRHKAHTVIGYKNWSGDNFDAEPKTGCSRAIQEMTIMWDGRVNLCCMDTGKVIFGNVKDQSVKEIWESPHRQMYAKAHIKGDYLKGLCSNCTGA